MPKVPTSLILEDFFPKEIWEILNKEDSEKEAQESSEIIEAALGKLVEEITTRRATCNHIEHQGDEDMAEAHDIHPVQETLALVQPYFQDEDDATLPEHPTPEIRPTLLNLEEGPSTQGRHNDLPPGD